MDNRIPASTVPGMAGNRQDSTGNNDGARPVLTGASRHAAAGPLQALAGMPRRPNADAAAPSSKRVRITLGGNVGRSGSNPGAGARLSGEGAMPASGQDRAPVALPAALVPVGNAFPRQDNEKNIAYARRLNLASQQGQPGARVAGQPLGLAQLASLSGAKESDLRRDPQLVALP